MLSFNTYVSYYIFLNHHSGGKVHGVFNTTMLSDVIDTVDELKQAKNKKLKKSAEKAPRARGAP